MQEDRRRDREEAQRRQLAVRGREALHQQIQDNAHLRELAKVLPNLVTDPGDTLSRKFTLHGVRAQPSVKIQSHVYPQPRGKGDTSALLVHCSWSTAGSGRPWTPSCGASWRRTRWTPTPGPPSAPRRRPILPPSSRRRRASGAQLGPWGPTQAPIKDHFCCPTALKPQVCTAGRRHIL